MFDTSMLMTLTTLTPTHPGSGTELSYVDMPIQREIHTGFPKIEAATLKGCIRNEVTVRHKGKEGEVNQLFGASGGGDFASALSFSDARLLFFPVKSVLGVFAWVTCPLALERFAEECKMIGCKGEFPGINKLSGGTAYIADKNTCRLIQSIQDKSKIMLEDYTFLAAYDHSFKEMVEAIQKLLPKSQLLNNSFTERAICLSDDDFTDFVQHSTEVNARIRVNATTGTAADNALFTEEMLPSDCILYSLIFCTDTYMSQKAQENETEQKMSALEVRNKFKELFDNDLFQIGADSTLGKGIVLKAITDGRGIDVTKLT